MLRSVKTVCLGDRDGLAYRKLEKFPVGRSKVGCFCESCADKKRTILYKVTFVNLNFRKTFIRYYYRIIARGNWVAEGRPNLIACFHEAHYIGSWPLVAWNCGFLKLLWKSFCWTLPRQTCFGAVSQVPTSTLTDYHPEKCGFCA